MTSVLSDIQNGLRRISLSHTDPPKLPTEVYLNHAENLLNWALEDEKKLVKAGMPEGFLFETSKRCKYYKIASAIYEDQRKSKDALAVNWNSKVRQAGHYKSKLFVTLGRVKVTRGTHAKLDIYMEKSQHLNEAGKLEELYGIALDNKNELLAEGMLQQEFNAIKIMAEELKTMSTYLDSEQKREAELKQVRNKAYTYLKQGLEQVIHMGIYALWREPGRLMGYTQARKIINQEY